MRSATPLLLVIALGIAGGVAAACTTENQQGKDDVAHANANALSGEPPADSLKCGTPVDGGACAVSFKTDIMGAFGAAGCGVAACHTTAPNVFPPIDVTNASTTWTTLQAFMTSSELPYINPCSTDPTQSGISANLLADPGATNSLHMPPSGQLSQDDIDKINTWVACGAPNN